MSNRPRLKPPASITAAARAYRCSDCPAVGGRPWLDSHGTWHFPVHHENECPVLAGTVSPLGDAIRAATASGSIVVITLPGEPA